MCPPADFEFARSVLLLREQSRVSKTISTTGPWQWPHVEGDEYQNRAFYLIEMRGSLAPHSKSSRRQNGHKSHDTRVLVACKRFLDTIAKPRCDTATFVFASAAFRQLMMIGYTMPMTSHSCSWSSHDNQAAEITRNSLEEGNRTRLDLTLPPSYVHRRLKIAVNSQARTALVTCLPS